MFIAKELIAKGLLAAVATGTAITLGVVYGDNIVKYLSSEGVDDLLKGVGLSCNSDDICSLKSGVTGLNVRLSESSKELNKTLPTAGTGTGKIKKLIAQESEGYNKNLKFAIVGGDITLTAPTAGVEGAGSTSITKLEEFETYEIKEDGGKYYFSRKTDVNAEIKKALGLPEACNLPTATGTEVDCDIAGESFKKINFEGKDGQNVGPAGAKLKISKVENTNNDYGNYKLKFVLESNSDAAIANGGTTIKANTNTEFKIKVSAATDNNSPRAVTLEKAWTAAKLAEKIGITTASACTETESTKECTIGGTINVYKDAGNYAEGATASEDEASKKLTFVIGEANYNQEYKFTAGTAITVTDPTDATKKAGTVGTIEASTAASYEIKEQTVSGNKKWFLSKVTSAS